MSQPLQPRRSARQPEPRRLLADEQAWARLQQEEAKEIERAIAEAAATVEPTDSDEHELADGECSDSADEQKDRPANESTPPWTRQLHDIHLPVCSAIPVVTLPTHRVSAICSATSTRL